MLINVIGLGYIGLPTALILAAYGNAVVGTDKKMDVIAKLNEGIVDFEEEGLQNLFDKAVNNRIKFTTEYQKADVYIVAVPTPYIKRDKKVDAAYVRNAVEDVLNVCGKGVIIVIESTISPGTIDKNIKPMIEERGFICGEDVHLVHAPERIIPGNMIKELENNNRTIGADDVEIGNKVRALYKTFCKGEIVVTDIKTAEMTKVVENTYRDINIAFANELAKICRTDNMNVYEIIRIANMHPRVNILTPGPGVGGHCISVDPWFLVGDYPGLANIILAARKINDSMPEFVLERISEIMNLEGISDVSKVGLYGLTYKENVDDIRESPTLQLLECMRKHLSRGIKVYDPFVCDNIVESQYQDFDEFLQAVDLVVIMVGHEQIVENMEELSNKIILDTRNVCKLANVYKL
ncbi:MAG: nucleotide sugar dehydrogenase [Lachnospiraceae bacterium]|nr:nucleotide sugar dehydrogenase [Lachnospiraceae bacterium]